MTPGREATPPRPPVLRAAPILLVAGLVAWASLAVAFGLYLRDPQPAGLFGERFKLGMYLLGGGAAALALSQPLLLGAALTVGPVLRRLRERSAADGWLIAAVVAAAQLGGWAGLTGFDAVPAVMSFSGGALAVHLAVLPAAACAARRRPLALQR